MLEQQQSQLVSGLQELYKRLRDVEQWDGAVLTEFEGRPLTHDILASLRLLETKHDGDVEAFEENVEKLQARLLASGAGFTRRRGSLSSESEQSQHGHARSASRDAPTASKPAHSTTTSSAFGSSSVAGPAPVQVQAQPMRPTLLASHDSQMSQLSQMSQMSPLSGDPQFYEAEWAFPQADHTTTTNKRLRAQFALQNERVMVANMAAMQRQQQQLQQQQQQLPSFDPSSWTSSPMGLGEMSSSAGSDAWATQQFLGRFAGSATSAPRATVDTAIISDIDADQMDIDLNQYIQSTAV